MFSVLDVQKWLGVKGFFALMLSFTPPLPHLIWHVAAWLPASRVFSIWETWRWAAKSSAHMQRLAHKNYGGAESVSTVHLPRVESGKNTGSLASPHPKNTTFEHIWIDSSCPLRTVKEKEGKERKSCMIVPWRLSKQDDPPHLIVLAEVSVLRLSSPL